MMLQKLESVLHTSNGAVASFNIVDLGMARAILTAAEEIERPVIVGIAVRHWEKIEAPSLSRSLKDMCEKSSIPTVLHLDHCPPDKFEILEEAVELGFTSVMIDGSKLPFEENVEITRRAVDFAHPRGVSVEAELGAIGGIEGEAKNVDATSPSLFTNPEEAARFIEASGADALAVSVGTAHGIYTSAPEIRFDIISRIAVVCPVPLVLHGASGVPDESIQRSVAAGISKINYFSGLLVKAMDTVRAQSQTEGNDYLAFRDLLVEGWKEDAKRQIALYSVEDQ
ncbi:MAG: class II fructose-bisphosphate aldolase [Spirochaetaceae bacterium]|nr:class II fructose-bisphosphate aldolase [Spirochaetaceae bacterium]